MGLHLQILPRSSTVEPTATGLPPGAPPPVLRSPRVRAGAPRRHAPRPPEQTVADRRWGNIPRIQYLRKRAPAH